MDNLIRYMEHLADQTIYRVVGTAGNFKPYYVPEYGRIAWLFRRLSEFWM
ncbi:hypothetical protein [Desulfonema limicola]|nr:hypothetical protein [Desulfonema limicola]